MVAKVQFQIVTFSKQSPFARSMGIDDNSDDIHRDEQTNVISATSTDSTWNKGLGYEFFKSMQQHKDKVAQYIAATGESDTYGSLLERIIRTALHLKERNLTKSDIVCLSSYNQLNSCVPLVACFFLGIPVVSMDPSFTLNDAAPLTKLVKPKVFFIVPEAIEVITQAMEIAEVESEVVVYGDDVDTNRFTPFDTFLEPHPEEAAFRPVIINDVSDLAIIFFSSGTTGLPKGICISHRSMYYQGRLLEATDMLFGENAVALSFSTLYWVSAVMILSSCILNGRARLICESFDALEVWHLIHRYKVTFIFLAPVQAYRMVAVGRPDGIDTSHVHAVMTGGAKFCKENLHEFRDLLPGAFIAQGYGCTEMGGVALVFNLTKVKDTLLLHYKPSSCGRPVPGCDYKVVDISTGNACGPNESGELRIKSDLVLIGYYNQDSSSAFDEEGWLRTGDIVHYDEDNCFYVEDRLKEVLKFRSWHVPPAALEEVLQTHPSVKECVVIGIPHEEDGDLPMAVIVLNDAFLDPPTEEEIEEFVAERVNDTHKLRGGVKFVEALPLTPTGKVQRRVMRDIILRELE